ncbi:MAG: glycosyltransferase family 4 protein [Synergistaceae bacterium]|jgi:glycosyltransferase involved in cell wall biosynthesis|nr:glycosyltransferase family 4 protein [Synergistaceae bacterium]
MSRVMLILPELSEGGVERHVVSLSRELCALGCWVTVVSAGGQLVSELAGGVKHIEMPVHRKNLRTIISCARKLADVAVGGGIQIIHAHSRVPAWIALLMKKLTGIKLVCTAHARYSLNYALLPFRASDGVICVSRSVRDYLSNWLPMRSSVDVIYNPKPDNAETWTGSSYPVKRLLYLGRLTKIKGPMVLIDALGTIGGTGWVLDVVGDGPMLNDLMRRAGDLGIADKVFFHGRRDDAEKWISRCDLFLFPSLDEGMSLSLIEGLSAGAPLLASDIPSVREITNGFGLIKPGDSAAWAARIEDYLWRPASADGLEMTVKLPSQREMAQAVLNFYEGLLS